MQCISHTALLRRIFALAVGLFVARMASATTVTYTDLYTLAKPTGVSSFTPTNAAGGQVVAYGFYSVNNDPAWFHALLWNNTSAATDLHPGSFLESFVYATDGTHQVGEGEGDSTGNEFHALLWNNTSAATDLHPAGYTSSTAVGIGGGYEVGYATGTLTGNQSHAMLWTAPGVVTDLHPATGFTTSSANAIAGGIKVGGAFITANVQHALLWNAANACTDLHPNGYNTSSARAVSDGQEVGNGQLGSAFHALLWNGTGPAIDLHPANFDYSVATGVAGGRQVGVGYGPATGGNLHALLWTGDASSYVDLHSVLPANFVTSRATSVSGTTVYGWALDTSNAYHAIAWTIPEPTSLSFLALAGVGMLHRRRRSSCTRLPANSRSETAQPLISEDRPMTSISRSIRNCALTLAASLLALLTTTKAFAATVTYTDVYTLTAPTGYSTFSPNGNQQAAGGQMVGYGSGTATGSNYHALLWNGTSVAVDLNPTGRFDSSAALGVRGGYQVGFGFGSATGNNNHALLWNGTNSAIDLSPTGFTWSVAYGVGGGQQVGYGFGTLTGNNNHALLWNGTNAATDLNPTTGFTDSIAYGVGGGYQVGYGSGTLTGNNSHALLWNGTNAAIDLHPATGLTYSIAYGVGDGQQVGIGYGTATGNSNHALLWNGTNAAIDLNPTSGFTQSFAYGVGGGYQVGYGYGTATGNNNHALLWNGSAASVIDLQGVLPGSFNTSRAYSISGGTIYGYAIDTSGNYHAITWSIPEPASLSLIALTGIALIHRHRSRAA